MSLIDENSTCVKVVFLTKEEGGRVSGPPLGDRYLCTVILLGSNGSPIDGEHHSAVFEFTNVGPEKSLANLRFLVPENLDRVVRGAAKLQLIEGPRIVAFADPVLTKVIYINEKRSIMTSWIASKVLSAKSGDLSLVQNLPVKAESQRATIRRWSKTGGSTIEGFSNKIIGGKIHIP